MAKIHLRDRYVKPKTVKKANGKKPLVFNCPPINGPFTIDPSIDFNGVFGISGVYDV
jgi:hypothetical protein